MLEQQRALLVETLHMPRAVICDANKDPRLTISALALRVQTAEVRRLAKLLSAPLALELLLMFIDALGILTVAGI